MTMQDDDERREYYRIDDTIALQFSLLANAEDFDAEALRERGGLFHLLGDLHVLDFESQHMLRLISERDRTLASYLKTLNKRIDVLGQAVAQHMLKDLAPAQTVSLSEGGISFSCETPLPVDQYLNLRMVMLPQPLGLQLCARVVHCAVTGDGRWEIGAEFIGLADAQRQLLARHILQKQAQQRRLARDLPDRP